MDAVSLCELLKAIGFKFGLHATGRSFGLTKRSRMLEDHFSSFISY
jgi:hypothetical protein